MSGSIPPGVIADAVAAAKLWLRVDSDEGVLAGLAETAILTAEAFVGRVVVLREGGTEGAASWAAVPGPIAQGTAMLVAHLFEARSGDVVPPVAVAALWRPYRQVRL
ncbi:head-tail connector protein [Sphingomonas sp. R86521]|uniref:head-tail connector protein n=1 Tax=Sphingomonas sp. R86521 TaxID=3093860 RepID=UPI0036D216AC